MQHLDGLLPQWLIYEDSVDSFFQIHIDTFQYDLVVDFYRTEVAGASHSE